MRPVEVAVQRLAHSEGLDLPAYATERSAGFDLPAAVTHDIVLKPGARALIPTGLSLERGVTVLNAPGTIDSDYRGEVGVLLINLGDAPFTVSRGQRIAQLIVAPVTRAVLNPAEELPDTDRGTGGFGSTGETSLQVAREGRG